MWIKMKLQNMRLGMGPGTIDYNGCTLPKWDRAPETVD